MCPGMPLEMVHILLTYKCIYQCDHCFLHCGPDQPGTMTVQEMEGLIEQAASIEGVTGIYFEGGEPMIYYPLVHIGVGRATRLGLGSSIVTCGYCATTVPDGRAWLRPLKEAGLGRVEVSIDKVHGSGEACTHGRNLVDACRALGIDVAVLSVCDPRDEEEMAQESPRPGEEASPVMLRGRAAHEMVEGLPLYPIDGFVECSSEDLERPTRVHVDPYGNVHICQGILAGNVWEGSLAQVVDGYDPAGHPILGPLIEGGPAALARMYGVGEASQYATECHACYELRRALRKVPELRRFLGPNQVYGEDPEPPPDCYD